MKVDYEKILKDAPRPSEIDMKKLRIQSSALYENDRDAIGSISELLLPFPLGFLGIHLSMYAPNISIAASGSAASVMLLVGGIPASPKLRRMINYKGHKSIENPLGVGGEGTAILLDEERVVKHYKPNTSDIRPAREFFVSSELSKIGLPVFGPTQFAPKESDFIPYKKGMRAHAFIMPRFRGSVPFRLDAQKDRFYEGQFQSERWLNVPRDKALDVLEQLDSHLAHAREHGWNAKGDIFHNIIVDDKTKEVKFYDVGLWQHDNEDKYPYPHHSNFPYEKVIPAIRAQLKLTA